MRTQKTNKECETIDLAIIFLVQELGYTASKYQILQLSDVWERYYTCVYPQILVRTVLLIFLVFCVVFLCFVCISPVSIVPNVASVSRLSILDCPFGFL